MNVSICKCLVVLFLACLADAKAPRMYGYERGKNFYKANWKDFMAKATWATDEVIKRATPYVLENYPTANVSEACTKSLVFYVDGIKNWKKWAIRMFDVTGKIPSSFKKGAGIEFGSYDDCLRIRVPTPEDETVSTSAQFCMLHIQTSTPFFLEKDSPLTKYVSLLIPSFDNNKRLLNWHLGICTPDTCSDRDIYNIVTAFIKFENVTTSVSNCETQLSDVLLEPTHYALLALVGLLILCFIGTVLDFKDRDCSEDERLNTSILRQSLKAFSIRANGIQLFDKDVVNVEIRRISGVLSILCMGIIVSNTIIYPTPWKEMRYTSFRDISMAVWFADSFVVAMDAIFFASGFLSIFALWRIAERRGGITTFFQEFLKVYFRLTAINAFTIVWSFTLATIYYGPLWYQTWANELVRCQHNGWLNLLNVQTRLPINDTCWMHTWYPALGMQFLVASIPLLFLLYKYPKIGLPLGILLTVVIMNSESPFTPKMLDSLHHYEMTRVIVAKYYSKPLLYFLPYLLGILAGRITLHFKDQELSKVLHLVGWSVSIAICLSVVSDGNFSKLNLEQSSLDLAKRTLYLCLALFWIMYASITEGIVGRTLSSGALSPFIRVTYIAYMVHVLLMVVREAALKERIYIGKLTLTIEATSHTVLSFTFGLLIHMMVELPTARLCDIFMGGNEGRKSNVVYSKGDPAEDEKKDS